MLRIYEPRDLMEAQMLVGMLETEGIEARVVGSDLLGAIGELPALGLLTFLLPRATTGTNRPEILNSPMVAVTITDDTEVAGFVIENPGEEATLSPLDASGVIIRDNRLIGDTTAVAGIVLNGFNGTIERNLINGFGDGMVIGDMEGTLSDNVLTGQSGGAIVVGDFSGDFSGNRIFNAGNEAIVMGCFNEGTFENNLLAGNGGGLILGLVGEEATFTDNTARGNTTDGFLISEIAGSFTDNLAEDNGGDGFFVGTIEATGVFSDNQAIDNTGAGYTVGTNNGTAENNTGSGNGSDDIFPP